MDAYVGAGGWGYFPGGLAAYRRLFRFVEVNATFYRIPPLARVRRWRASVPTSFRFAVKAPRTIGHAERLRPTPRAARSWAEAVRVSRELRAEHVIVQVPQDVEVDVPRIRDLRDLVSTSPRPRFVGLEVKAWHRTGPRGDVLRAMERSGIADVADLSVRRTATGGDEGYVRVFGPGKGNRWQFDGRELAALSRAAQDADVDRMFFAFHGVRMYSDAARFEAIQRGRTPPPVSRAVGRESIESILREDARFPATRDALLEDQGWKVYDVGPGETEHVSAVLGRISARTYGTAREVADAVAAAPPREVLREGRDPRLM